jgi:hypothetical protein
VPSVVRSRPSSRDGIEHVVGVDVGRAVAALLVVEGEALLEADELLDEALEPDVVVAGGAGPPDAHAPSVTATVAATMAATVSNRSRPTLLVILPSPT